MKWVSTHYNDPEILITENGYQNRDATANDDRRIFYIQVSKLYFHEKISLLFFFINISRETLPMFSELPK